MKRKQTGIIIASLFIAITAVAALSATKPRLKVMCKDVRLYMDDGVYASIEFDAFKSHMQAIIYKKKGMHLVEVGKSQVSMKREITKGQLIEDYYGPGVRVLIKKSDKKASGENPGSMAFQNLSQKFTAQLLCLNK